MVENPPSHHAGTPSPTDLFGKIEDLLNKLPKFPGDHSKFVSWVPWINLIFVIFFLPIVLGIFGLQLALLPFAEAVVPGFTLRTIFYDALLLVTFVIDIAALPGLFAKSLRGWKLVFFGTLLGVVFNIINGSIGAIIFSVIYLRFLVQVKSYYH